MNARCDVCGSPVAMTHEKFFVCSRDASHTTNPQALPSMSMGGPGSGWHAHAGHVPGSQGGKKGKGSGSAKSDAGPSSHRAAAKAHMKAAVSHMDALSYGGSHSKASQQFTKDALEASKTLGSEKHFQAQAAATYSKMAAEAPRRADRKKYHELAAKAHRGMANNHAVMAKNAPKAEGKSSKKPSPRSGGGSTFKGDPKGAGTYKAGSMELEVYQGKGGWYVNTKGGHSGFASRYRTPAEAHRNAQKAIKDFEE